MKTKINLAFLFFFIVTVIHAQKIALEAQGNGKDVKLFWFCGEWSQDMEGVVIKRKSGNKPWQALSGVIKPAVVGEDLTTRTNDASLVAKLITHRDSALAVERLQKTDAQKFKSDVLLSEGALRMLPLITNFNYNDALVMGFAYYDKNVPSSAHNYTYGIFASRNGQVDVAPITTAEWRYGDKVIPKTSEESCLKKRLRKDHGFQLTWFFQKDFILKEKVRDYLVYKTDTLGNKQLITPSPLRIDMSFDPVKIYYINADYYFKEKATFEVVLRDVFDTPRLKFSVQITPDEFPDFPNPTLTISHQNERDQNTTVTWGFPKEYKDFIVDVQIKKGMTPENMEVIEIHPNKTSYVDDQNTKSGVYYYKLKITTSTGDVLFSQPQRITKYFPVIPPRPTGLTVELADGKAVLKWYKDPNDPITKSYLIYKKVLDSKELAHLSYLPKIEVDSCVLPLGSSFGGVHRFAIRAVGESIMRSDFSDTVQLVVPTEKMPFVEIYPFQKDKNRVTLQWKYPTYVDDLAGFRLYQDGELIADETELDATKRQWRINNLKIKNYNYTLEAVSTSGVLSKMSQIRYFNIKEKYE